MQSAPVVWLTGLSGSGKTTIARALHQQWQTKGIKSLLLDGDHLREVFGGLFGYSREERLKASLCYARCCKMLSEQGILVICATISLFHETQDWNRLHIPGYVEVYVRVPLDVLKKRDSKKIYARAEAGEIKDVIGIDIQAEEPQNPDIIIDNYGEATTQQAVERIIAEYKSRFKA